MAVILTGFGIATLAARKVLAIMILGIIVASFSLIVALGRLADLSDYTSLGSIALGLPIVLIGAGVALGGAITGCATRRKWRT